MKEFIVMDWQDCTDWEYMNIEEIKDFILNMWNDSDYKSKEEELAHEEKIRNGNIDVLQEALHGLHYLMFNDERERLEWMYEVELLTKEEFEKAREEEDF